MLCLCRIFYRTSNNYDSNLIGNWSTIKSSKFNQKKNGWYNKYYKPFSQINFVWCDFWLNQIPKSIYILRERMHPRAWMCVRSCVHVYLMILRTWKHFDVTLRLWSWLINSNDFFPVHESFKLKLTQPSVLLIRLNSPPLFAFDIARRRK